MCVCVCVCVCVPTCSLKSIDEADLDERKAGANTYCEGGGGGGGAEEYSPPSYALHHTTSV